MAQRFNRAMEVMGWRIPDEDEVSFDDVLAGDEEAEIREVDFQSHAAVSEPKFDVVSKPAASVRRISTVHPSSYGDARLIGEAFRDGTPVIMNLEALPDAEARRIVDFAAGLVFGMHGAIERVTARVFLLSPRDVEVSSQATGHATNIFG